MVKWSSLEWLKRLAILLFIFLNCYVFYRLIPFLSDIFHFITKILFPFVVAALISYLLHPIVKLLHRNGIPKTVAILLIYVVFFGLVGLGLYKGFPILIKELRGYDYELSQYGTMYHHQVDHVYDSTPEAVHHHVNHFVANLEHELDGFVKRALSALSWFFHSFLTLLIIPFLSFYFLKDIEQIGKVCKELLPERLAHSSKKILFEIDDSLGKYIRGQLYVCAILALIAFFGLWILKIPYPMVFGAFVGITDIIPYFGPLIGAIPVVFMATMISVKKVIFVLLLIGIIQLLEGNVIEPLVVGKSVEVHPLLIVLSLIIGGEIGGVVGMLFAVPAFIVLRVIIKSYRQTRALTK
ncbi:AI-2E family transporter [Terrilactibacillus laevilacticus]|uniref:AI-2E family transporter n=1 Tax=Terrilactibacillus laevilacticus TaxID=1380157 RepID=A0ABW5PTW0_9BACI|nr:AI-2E family transporter [Terrilactibacillus laevilacticus]